MAGITGRQPSKGGGGVYHLPMAGQPAKQFYDPQKPQVNILSVQSSKGLESHSVIFIGLGQISSSSLITAH